MTDHDPNENEQICHDLRGPLQAVMGYVELLDAELSGPLNPEQKRFVGQIRRGAQQALLLLEKFEDR